MKLPMESTRIGLSFTNTAASVAVWPLTGKREELTLAFSKGEKIVREIFGRADGEAVSVPKTGEILGVADKTGEASAIIGGVFGGVVKDL